MNPLKLIALLASLLTGSASGQQLSASDHNIAESSRSKYYSLSASGFKSLACAVKFDFSTVPSVSQNGKDATRAFLEMTGFTLALDDKGRPNVQHHFPKDSSASAQDSASPAIGLLTSLIGGLFQTWALKGLQGPIPPFDSQIEKISAVDTGYLVNLRVPGAPVQVLLDKTFLVRAITSVGGKLIEHPLYVDSPEGFVFVGNEAVDNSGQGGQTIVKYDLGLSVINGLRVPTSVRLRVNTNIDVRYALVDCIATRAIVVRTTPPVGHPTP